MSKKFSVSENTIMWAFRYALGRRTGAVLDVCDTLKENWKKLSTFTKQQIKEEITNSINTSTAGADCDVESWNEILKL